MKVKWENIQKKVWVAKIYLNCMNIHFAKEKNTHISTIIILNILMTLTESDLDINNYSHILCWLVHLYKRGVKGVKR